MGISVTKQIQTVGSYHRHHLIPALITLGKSKWFPKSRIAKLQYSRQSHIHLLGHLSVNPADLSHTSLTLSTPGWLTQNSSLSWIRCSIFITSLLGSSSHPAVKKNLSCKMSLVTSLLKTFYACFQHVWQNPQSSAEWKVTETGWLGGSHL